MARKITTSIVSAFLAGKELKESNSHTDGTYLYLFGNLIAKKDKGNIYITNAGWKSNTTKERLNAIPGVNIYQKAKKWYLNGNEWDGKLTKVN